MTSSGTASSGGTSSIKNIIATGGGGAWAEGAANGKDRSAGSGGNPNGKSGTSPDGYTSKTSIIAYGGTGFALNFLSSGGTYGQGGSIIKTKNTYINFAGGGSGGYFTDYINVSSSEILTIIVGFAGTDSIPIAYGETYSSPTSGFALIAYGEGIE